MRQVKAYGWILLTLVLLNGCARSRIKTAQEAMRPYEGQIVLQDDLGMESFLSGLESHIRALSKWPQEQMRFGERVVSKEDYLLALTEILKIGKKEGAQKAKEVLESQFKIYEIYGDEKWGQAFITSYFDPVIKGSKKPQGRYTQPLYALPDDMVIIDVGAFAEKMPRLSDFANRIFEQKSRQGYLRGRLEKQEGITKVVPYFTRKEIDSEWKLKGRTLELVWVDPIDAFFLQIQGSGSVELPNGKVIKVGYAGQNGHSYYAIGKHLLDVIPKEEMSMQRIEQYLRGLNAEEMQEIFNLNPSYVFFKVLDGEAITYMGAEVVAGRTIATDYGFFPKGALGYLVFDKPQFGSSDAIEPTSWSKASRLVFDQDTGGAIRGPHRLDLFWGRGREAKQAAGVMRHHGRLYYLAPKESWIVQLKEGVRSSVVEK